MSLLDGKKTSAVIKDNLKKEVLAIREKLGRPPVSAIVLVGDNHASEVYVRNKLKTAEAIGIQSRLLRFQSSITQQQLLSVIADLNNDDNIDGFIVQLPLPKHIDQDAIIDAIDPRKDIDGFHPLNIGRMLLGLDAFIPATPLGILEMIKFYNIPTEGRHCVIVGRSNIVGRPMAVLLARNTYPGNATVTLCHSRTANLSDITKQADILIVSVGKPRFITADMVKPGAVVIDVGINSVVSNSSKSGRKLVGDVDFEAVSNIASYITPVPGGVGPMTIAALMINTLKAAKLKFS